MRWFRATLPVLVLPVILAVIPPVAVELAAEPVGRIEYLHGEAALLRDGEIVQGPALSPGEELFGMEVIQTGSDGYVEVLLTTGGRAAVRIRENTAYYVDTETRTDGGIRTRLRLLSGSLEIGVEQIARNSTMDVETRTAVIGVRGTEFDILTAPDGSSLLGVRRGRVDLSTQGRQARVEEGLAVEMLPDSPPAGRVVPEGDFDRFYASWRETRLRAFRSGAPVFIQAYVRRFRDTEPSFQASYQELMRHRDRLREATRSDSPGPGADMRLRTEVSPAIIGMRSVLPLFENTFYRLRELDRFHRQGIGRTMIDGEDSEDFFRRFARDERRLMGQLSEVRAVFRLYQEIEKRSFGGLPGGESPFGGAGLLDSMRF
ncbi:MAG: hypothetical protein EA427_06245 [Spirochaetaceae bacterium]|nr:MAG: hypothetical protein EA427_06245 [Spirochaetaceae bacterium]